ncbi:MAG: 5-formyltetrahydrofolate cyclo-ligase [Spirochaetales bacterium]|nr:5-formyltetrahydrofolate cyclo-ligase [Spirochaetales bacterium]
MQETKQSIRQGIKSTLAAFPQTLLDEKSRDIADILFESSMWQRADIIFIYLSFGKEVKTDMMVLKAFSGEKTVAVPRITGRDMVFHQITTLDSGLVMNRMGIREPLSSLPVIEPSGLPYGLENSLIITPGLAFDRQKNRLGRGGGYYDRLISQIRKAGIYKSTIVGVCFFEQMIDSVPVGPGDEKVDMIVNDKDIIY